MSIFDFILNHIPPWLYYTVLALIAAALFYFFSPILIPIWRIMPNWVKALGAAVVAIIGAILYGRSIGSKSERDAQAKRDAEAINKRVEVDQRVDAMPASEVQKKLRDRWGAPD